MSNAKPGSPLPLTVTLRNKLVVLAKVYEGREVAVTYANRTQATRAAAKYGAIVVGTRPFYVARQCPYCGTPERETATVGYVNLAPFSGACADCINKAVRS